MSSRSRALGRVRAGVQMLPLIGAPVLPMPDHVRRAAARALDGPDPRDTRGLPGLRDAIAAELARDHDLQIDPDRRLLITHGAMQGLSLVLRTMLAPGDEVIVPTPTFFFDGFFHDAAACPVYVPSLESEDWALDLARIEGAVTPRTRAILLCNPNNPTGHLPDTAALAAVADLAARHGLFVISDESWQHFAYDGRQYTPVESFAHRWPHLITVTSLSKYYSLASWRVGYVVAQPSVIEALERRFQWEAVCCGVVAQAAATAALTGPRGWLRDAFATYPAKRALICEGITTAGLPAPIAPEAGAFLLVNCSALGTSPEAIDNTLLSQGISTIRGADLHAPDTHVRLTFGADEHVLSDLVDRLARAVSLGRSA